MEVGKPTAARMVQVKNFRNDLTTEELSDTGPFCAEFSFRVRKQRNTKDDTARKKIVTKSFTISLKNRPRTYNNFRPGNMIWSSTLKQIFF